MWDGTILLSHIYSLDDSHCLPLVKPDEMNVTDHHATQ